MKIALCLSGHMRKFHETFHSLYTHMIGNYECDTFIHTWDRMGYCSNYKRDSVQNNTAEHIIQIEKVYRPKKIIVEDSSFVEELKRQGNEYAPHLKGVLKPVGHMASMFYKIYACNELKNLYQIETGTEYDWVVRARPDLTFHARVKMPAQKVPGQIYLSQHQCSPGWLNDQFAIGLPDDMDLYSSCFFNIPEYFEARNEYYPEKFMDWCLKKKNLKPVMWDLHYTILR